ncbi:MAG: biotin--[acetyl-CoA-carboxylase] ligase [Burkholderiaceae bacterium]
MAAIDIDSIRTAAGEGLRVTLVDRIESTNRTLMTAPFESLPAPPHLLVAQCQTAGRGRQGRNWLMEPGRSAAFSVAVERLAAGARPMTGLSIAIGVALAEVLATLAGPVELKWPNDLQRAGRKLGGILIESRRSVGAASIERCVIGVGLNLLAPQATGDLIGQPAAGLFDGDRLAVPAGEIVGRAARAVLAATEGFVAAGLAPFADTWRRLDALQGREIEVLAGGRVEARGVAQGIDGEGALLIDTPAGRLPVRWGEVSVRPFERLASAGGQAGGAVGSG